MRRLGSVLMTLGVAGGVATGLAILADVPVPGVGSWLVGVAVAKLALVGSTGLIAAGAALHRLGARSNTERAIDAGPGGSGRHLHAGADPPADPANTPRARQRVRHH